MLELKEANIGDCKELAENLRRIEVKEVFLCSGVCAQQAVYGSFKNALHSFTVSHNGKVVSMFGIVANTGISLYAQVYMLTTDEVYNVNKFQFVRLVKKALKTYTAFFKLFSYCLAEHTENTRFMEFLNAKIVYNAAIINGHKFHYIEL
jgi:hypothetical protein